MLARESMGGCERLGALVVCSAPRVVIISSPIHFPLECLQASDLGPTRIGDWHAMVDTPLIVSGVSIPRSFHWIAVFVDISGSCHFGLRIERLISHRNHCLRPKNELVTKNKTFYFSPLLCRPVFFRGILFGLAEVDAELF